MYRKLRNEEQSQSSLLKSFSTDYSFCRNLSQLFF